MATISSLSASSGTKIAITESSGTALYTLVHHNYNNGKAMLFRDASIGTKAWRSSTPSSTNNIFQGSTLDAYLTSWYSTLPSTTTKYLTTLDYPVTDKNYGGSKIYITRDACTISLAETGLADHANWQDIGDLDCLDTLGCGSLYWTRQPSNGTTSAYRITAAGTNYGTVAVTNTSGVRPTLGVLETQDVEYDSSLGAYVLVDAPEPTQCGAPSAVLLWGTETDMTDVEPGEELYLSWREGTGTYITGYAVYTSASLNSGYTLYTTTTDQYVYPIPAPTSYSTTLYFRVQTLGQGGINGSYNSALSTAYRYVRTKADPNATQPAAPAALYLNGGAYNYGEVEPGSSFTLSWDASTSSSVIAYTVYYKDTGDTTYTAVGTVSSLSKTVYASDSYSTTRTFYVRAISSNNYASDYSTATRYVTTKAAPVSVGTTISYYNGTSWVDAIPQYYNGSTWISPKIWYYNGSTWLPIPPVAQRSASVENLSSPGFALNANGYYESQNSGDSYHNTYALCKVNIVADGVSRMYVDYISGGESYNNTYFYDYGLISKLDVVLSSSDTYNSSNKHDQFNIEPSSEVRTLDFGVLSAGEHYFYAKYTKDRSDNSTPDSLQFKVRFE